MQLNVSRFFSDRLVFDADSSNKLRVTRGFWDWVKRIVSWIWCPCSYSSENRRTIQCFKKCLIDTLGEERLQRICSRYSLDLDAMEQAGSSLLSRDVAKIVIGAKNVSVEDVNEFIHKAHEAGIPDPRFEGKNSFLDLDAETLAGVIEGLSQPFGDHWTVEEVAGKIGGGATEWLSRIFYDPFLADRERLQISKEHATDSFSVFFHNMTARVIKREMDVGTLIQAPNSPEGKPQYYYVSGKVVTGEGMVSYIFHPATADMNLEPMRLFRGTSARNSELDGISTIITDFEKHLGHSAYESGMIYEKTIEKVLGKPTVEGGHSLGATMVQYRLANMDHIKKAYLFCGPGLPESEVNKFNEKNPEVELVIRHSVKDHWSSVGDMHLGYDAPPNVKVDFMKFHPPQSGTYHSPHVTVWGKMHKIYGIEGGHSPEKVNQELYHKNKRREKVRSSLGPFVAKALRGVRNACRRCFGSRADEQKGLKIGLMRNGRWQVDYYRPMSY